MSRKRTTFTVGSMRRESRINDNQTTGAKREAAKAKRTTAKMELMERQEAHLTKRTVDLKASQRRVESFHDKASCELNVSPGAQARRLADFNDALHVWQITRKT